MWFLSYTHTFFLSLTLSLFPRFRGTMIKVIKKSWTSLSVEKNLSLTFKESSLEYRTVRRRGLLTQTGPERSATNEGVQITMQTYRHPGEVNTPQVVLLQHPHQNPLAKDISASCTLYKSRTFSSRAPSVIGLIWGMHYRARDSHR